MFLKWKYTSNEHKEWRINETIEWKKKPDSWLNHDSKDSVSAANEHHACEISQLESLKASTSELLRQQNKVYMEEMDRLDRTRGAILQTSEDMGKNIL